MMQTKSAGLESPLIVNVFVVLDFLVTSAALVTNSR